tara:strand:+ start:24590 stop:25414 length:825 start_codon:yes stop_codon:yes gene_type:complete
MECKNCKQQLQEKDQYCSICGAKLISHRLTLRNAWGEFQDRFLNIDNTFFKTYIHLFKNPVAVIGGYIEGMRKRYINVFSYFAIALTLTGIQIFIVRRFYPESLELPFGIGANLPESYENMDWIYDFISIITLINLPIYALVARLTFIGHKKYNYAEQLVIMTYIFSQYSISSFPIILIAVAAGVNYYVLGYVVFIPLFIYTAYVYTKLYQLSWNQIFLRGLILIAVIIVCLLLISILQFLVLISNGGMEEFIEAQKAKQGISYSASSIINWTS